MRLHAYYCERVFQRPEPLRSIGVLASSHHERMDASGYHRGTGGALLSVPARVLGAADAYQAMTQERPHRKALDPDEAAAALRSDASAGLFDPAVVEAVLDAATGGPSGDRRVPEVVPPARSPIEGSRGDPLTAREAEVLRLLAKGEPNKAIARDLGISPKTVSNHLEHIYAKLDVSNRAGAALHAMRLGLI